MLAMDAPRFSRPYASSLTAIASKPASTWEVWRTLIFKGRLFLQGQVQGDTGAAPLDAVSDADPPAMGADHALTDRQPQAGTLPALSLIHI